MQAVQCALHGATLVWYLRVWLWHLTPQAALLPGAVGFGWFFKYMTFWSFSLQTISLATCLLCDLLCSNKATLQAGPSRPGSSRQRQQQQQVELAGAGSSGTRQQQQQQPGLLVLAQLSDDLSCMSFAFAHVVTIMFHAVSAATNGVVEGAEALRPPWLNPSMHVLNSVVAWVDLMVSQPRTFSRRSRWSCCGLAAAYTCWILLCREVNGRFPYPFLNVLPFPSGFLFIAVSSVIVFAAFFQIGSLANSSIGWVSGKVLGKGSKAGTLLASDASVVIKSSVGSLQKGAKDL